MSHNFWHYFETLLIWAVFIVTFAQSYVLVTRPLRKQPVERYRVIIAAAGWASIIMFYNT